MTKTIKMKLCDVCKKEVKSFAGTFDMTYVDYYAGISVPGRINYNEICIDCCRKLKLAIDEVLQETKE